MSKIYIKIGGTIYNEASQFSSPPLGIPDSEEETALSLSFIELVFIHISFVNRRSGISDEPGEMQQLPCSICSGFDRRRACLPADPCSRMQGQYDNAPLRKAAD